MDMRVRGKSTARPEEVGGPTLKSVGVGNRNFPTPQRKCIRRAKAPKKSSANISSLSCEENRRFHEGLTAGPRPAGRFILRRARQFAAAIRRFSNACPRGLYDSLGRGSPGCRRPYS